VGSEGRIHDVAPSTFVAEFASVKDAQDRYLLSLNAILKNVVRAKHAKDDLTIFLSTRDRASQKG
jgi:hypothetical protein